MTAVIATTRQKIIFLTCVNNDGYIMQAEHQKLYFHCRLVRKAEIRIVHSPFQPSTRYVHKVLINLIAAKCRFA